MRHTPGPWRVGTDGNVYTGETNGNLVAKVMHDAEPERFDSSKPGNALLIAAAPDLLAACKTSLESHTYGEQESQRHPDSPYYFLWRAIAIAQGKPVPQ